MPGRKILLVEGRDDKHVLKHICGDRGLPRLGLRIKPLGNVERLLENFPVRLRASNEEGDAVGVVIDADTDLESRIGSLSTVGLRRLVTYKFHQSLILTARYYTPPPNSLLPTAGIWIMPDNKTAGILEDFLRFLIPQPDALRGPCNV